MTASLAPQTYLPDEQDTRQIAEVVSFLEAHAAKGGTVAPRYYLVGAEEGDQVELPRAVYEALGLVAEALMAGKAVTVSPASRLLTTQQAADLLGVSRPTVVRLADSGTLPFERAGNRRRIRLGDLLEYREQRRAAQYDMLAATSISLDQEDDLETVRAQLVAARRAAADRRASS